ncbi:hypothetical protein SCLCIDRAFT_107614 [Scleroderma citrinum Foug A]|uniref:Uncharacterized protein n=1 Tax=Scleroderma citrinum Foug A TaxID=1036808 RepID=A0A0C3A1J8_9AGAM|nr:hypothetical protein SCLCIDRAFT_107614 [Scleroderma citrinum Foug A]
MLRTKADALDGLESSVPPIIPLRKTFSVLMASGKKISITQQQLSITPAYVFTDYRSQAQRLHRFIPQSQQTWHPAPARF